MYHVTVAMLEIKKKYYTDKFLSSSPRRPEFRPRTNQTHWHGNLVTVFRSLSLSLRTEQELDHCEPFRVQRPISEVSHEGRTYTQCHRCHQWRSWRGNWTWFEFRWRHRPNFWWGHGSNYLWGHGSTKKTNFLLEDMVRPGIFQCISQHSSCLKGLKRKRGYKV